MLDDEEEKEEKEKKEEKKAAWKKPQKKKATKKGKPKQKPKQKPKPAENNIAASSALVPTADAAAKVSCILIKSYYFVSSSD